MTSLLFSLLSIQAFAAKPYWAQDLSSACRQALRSRTQSEDNFAPWSERSTRLEDYASATLLVHSTRAEEIAPIKGARILQKISGTPGQGLFTLLHGDTTALLNLTLPKGSRFQLLDAQPRLVRFRLAAESAVVNLLLSGGEASGSEFDAALETREVAHVSDLASKQRYYIYPRERHPGLVSPLITDWGVEAHTLEAESPLMQLRQLGSLLNRRAWCLKFRDWIIVTEPALSILKKHQGEPVAIAETPAIAEPSLQRLLRESLAAKSVSEEPLDSTALFAEGYGCPNASSVLMRLKEILGGTANKENWFDAPAVEKSLHRLRIEGPARAELKQRVAELKSLSHSKLAQASLGRALGILAEAIAFPLDVMPARRDLRGFMSALRARLDRPNLWMDEITRVNTLPVLSYSDRNFDEFILRLGEADPPLHMFDQHSERLFIFNTSTLNDLSDGLLLERGINPIVLDDSKSFVQWLRVSRPELRAGFFEVRWRTLRIFSSRAMDSLLAHARP